VVAAERLNNCDPPGLADRVVESTVAGASATVTARAADDRLSAESPSAVDGTASSGLSLTREVLPLPNSPARDSVFEALASRTVALDDFRSEVTAEASVDAARLAGGAEPLAPAPP
jgi:hypothetical protein